MFPSKIIPVIVIEEPQRALPLGNCLIENNLPVAEVTLRTDRAIESIKIMSGIENLVTGAGTVITVDQAKAAVDAGAKFLVSPGLNEKVVKFAQSVNTPIIPGVVTPTEVEQAIDLGLDLVKLFPAEAVGGANLLHAYASVYPNVKFMPTGGISPHNVSDYLALPNVIACGGSWLTPSHLLKQDAFDQIGQLIKAASFFTPRS